jgi:Fe-S-cluster containining protein
MKKLAGTEVVEFACETLDSTDLTPETLASICGRVFRTRAWPDVDSESGVHGIRVETGMEDFRCRQCGRCCRVLDYHDQVTREDVEQWNKAGRSDILDWVSESTLTDGRRSFRIWTTPGTREIADECPFLARNSAQNRWVCGIHEIKPGICRNYPVSRKHALMTGCPGFDEEGA